MFEKIKKIFFKKKKKKNIININNKKLVFSKKEIIFDEIANKVLNKKQQELKPLLEEFSRTHFLWGWTAIALQIWHRESIDFDFFSDWIQWSFSLFIKRINKYGFDVTEKDKKYFAWIEFLDQDEIHTKINWVKVSLINFYRTLYNNQNINIKWETFICWWLRVASLEELSAMKVFAMIWRNKWKDAVDLFYLIKKLNINLSDILNLAEKKYFINIFNKNAVLEQLISQNWDKTETVKYLIKNPPKDKEIENFLEKEALKILKKS